MNEEFPPINFADYAYLTMCRQILKCGNRKPNRTGVDTIGLFGHSMFFNLDVEGFPLLTTKEINFDNIVHELLWFISGNTNVKYLIDRGVNIWNDDAYRHFRKRYPLSEMNKAQWKESIVEHGYDFPYQGALGYGTYGSTWRGFGNIEDCSGECESQSVDQLAKLIDTLKNNPDDRRMLVNAWDPTAVDDCALPPCHVLFQCHTEILEIEERMAIVNPQGRHFIAAEDVDSVTAELDSMRVPKRRLNLAMYQRSCDMFLGVPYNIASYALLTHMLAHCTNMTVGTFTHFLGDAHIYVNHIDAIKEQLNQLPKKAPRIELNPKQRDLFKFTYEDIKLIGYEHCGKIKAQLNTGV